ncbi:helix-turn-helix domain-containing protein, partial [uncultured Sneathia sp.]
MLKAYKYRIYPSKE